MRTPLFLLLTAVVAAAAPVGPFPADIRHGFTVADGLPSDDVRCVAVAGPRVYAGTAKGLAVRDGGRWSPVVGVPIAGCAAAGDGVVAATADGLIRETGARLAAWPGGRFAALGSGRGREVWLATSNGVFQFRDGGLRPVTVPETGEIRQIALSAAGAVALAGEKGLFVRESEGGVWVRALPRAGERSWAPVDVRGAAFDGRGRLWFVSPEGLGRRESGVWTLWTGREGLPTAQVNALTASEEGLLWMATAHGAIRFDGETWEVRQGPRWVPDDAVRGVAINAAGEGWFATARGAGWIERRPMTLAAKAKFFEEEIDRYHRRTPYQYVMAVRLGKAGDKATSSQTDSDNDGLWTGMYGAGECFAWAATKDPAARRRAVQAFTALRFLSQVTQGGPHPAPRGFPARSILPTSGPDPNAHDNRERDVQFRARRDHLWKIMDVRWPRSADGEWFWKSDTSSDELDGHYFFYAVYYDLVASSEEEKNAVRTVVREITDHLIDHDFNLVDWDGKPTRWGVFGPAGLNGSRAWWSDRGLDSLSMLSYLKVAEHVTGDAKYRKIYDSLATEHGFLNNAMISKVRTGPGSGNQSDDEMAFMNYYTLLQYADEPEHVSSLAYSLANYWGVERPEMNPFFNFVAASRLTGKRYSNAFRTVELTPKGDWLADSIDTLRRIPLDRVDWAHDNSWRLDVQPLRAYVPEDEDLSGLGVRPNGKVLPADERFFSFWNHNPFRLKSGGSGKTLADGAAFLLPYYMGLYLGYLEEAK